uniref:KIB1-4 beta-propeller domain-containing protein n=1 Tax=Leersia perrieri TaxID=77586 RepID=A0A0D9VFZ2_9ORYZ
MDPLPVPCLALYEGDDTPKPTFFDIFEEVEVDCGVDSLKNNKKTMVRDTNTPSTFLQNPLDSDDKIQLPHLPEDLPRDSTSVLSGKPSIPGCVVLLVESVATVIWHCRVREDDEWTRHEYDIGTHELIPPLDGKDHEKVPIYSIAACQGKFYFNTKFSYIGMLEFTPGPMFRMSKVFLVESNEELYMVYLAYRGLFGRDDLDYETRVYKMDFSEQQWCRTNDLAGRAFLLTPWYFAASCLASEHGLYEDCVYASFPTDDEISSVKDGWEDFVELPAAHKALWITPTDP